MAHILIVDDEQKIRHLLSIMLNVAGHTTAEAADGREAQTMLSGPETFDVVISDIKMPNIDGMNLLKWMKEQNIPTPLIFITAFASIDSAVEGMRMGAVDFITKPFEEKRILLAVERTLQVGQLISENKNLKDQLEKKSQQDILIVESEPMKKIIGIVEKVANKNSTVLLTGESGTGKEVIARYIHKCSNRAKQRFVPVNCAAISPNLVESELFGHNKGAFTGALRKKIGKFEYANGGTLFLDEIGDLPLDAQSKLLRALQDKKIQYVGGNREIEVDVRVICATNKDLTKLVEEQKFREDLFYRINVFPIHIPPLRERKEEIIPLANFFLSKFSEDKKYKISDAVKKALTSYPWPGNVRELANAMERIAILTEGREEIKMADIEFLKHSQDSNGDDIDISLPPEGICLEKFERQLVLKAMEQAQNNQTAAAKLLGVSRAKFRVLLKKAQNQTA